LAATTAEVYADAFDRGLRPDPLLSVSEWADRHRRLSGRAAAEPGPWRTSRTPYLKEITAAISQGVTRVEYDGKTVTYGSIPEMLKAQFATFVRDSGHDAGGGCYVWNGSKWEQQSSKSWRDPGFQQTDRDPVACANWDDAKAYVGWLSKKTGKGYRLPSEAEWEYAARARTATARYWGDGRDEACANANVNDRTSKSVNGFPWTNFGCDDGHAGTAPAGSFRANAFGLHDMLGNLWEWGQDCWNESYSGALSNGSALTSGDCSRRVLRGGSWVNLPGFVRSADRVGGGSSTLQLFHGSEVSVWPNAADHVAGVLQAVPDAPGTEVILESTANGVGGLFHERWQQAEAGIGDFVAIFIPWWLSDEYRRLVDEDFAVSKNVGEAVRDSLIHSRAHGVRSHEFFTDMVKRAHEDLTVGARSQPMGRTLFD
jgi:hypothetical protein